MTVIQRPLKGSRISSFYPVKSVPPLSALDSAFQLQEYISLLIRSDVHDVEAIVSLPGPSHAIEREGSDEEKNVEKDGKGEVAVDESCWVYEQLRRLAQDLTHPLITTLQHECTRQTCPEMKAGEWQYLCVAHGNEGSMEQCCAIDYILHTLDSATALLNSPRAFPSRLSIPPTSTRHFSSLARRLGRIFAHAYYHHREAFEQAEVESSLYARFLALTSKFNLVASEFLVIPPRLASLDDENERDEPSRRELPRNEPHQQEPRHWLSMGDSPSVINLSTGGSNSPTPDIARSASPRKIGRSRTDTMVYSEAAHVVEELANNEHIAEDLDRAIAAERLLSADQPLPPGEQAEDIDLQPSSQASGASDTDLEEPQQQDLEPSEEVEPEIHLDLSAPPPAEPAIPTDIEDQMEEDITEESTSASLAQQHQTEAEISVEEQANVPEITAGKPAEESATPESTGLAEIEQAAPAETEKKAENTPTDKETEVQEASSSEPEEPPVIEADVVEHARLSAQEEETEASVSELEAAKEEAAATAPAATTEEST